MRIHRILPLSRVNGPGARFTVWVQGCPRRCAGCFNPLTHDEEAGFEMPVTDILAAIPREAAGVTVSGGEPFRQPEELALLLEAVRARGLPTLVYTGFQYEELKNSEDAAVRQSLFLTDILIDGDYREGIPPAAPWTGSGNQRVLELARGEVFSVYDGLHKEDGVKSGEILIDKTGGLIATGFFDSSYLEREG